MATLYDQISSNNRKAFFLIFFFLIFVIFIGWAFSYFFNESFILYFAVIFSVLMSFIGYFNSDKVILTMTHAHEVQKKDNPELYRIVENLAITAGMPIPKIYILEEAQPNAFATGRDEKHAVVAVTRGLLNKLDKRELEGVIAHEIAHIKGKDILIGSMIVVLVGIVSLISDIFLRSLFWSDNSDSKNPLFLILAVVGMILAPFAATIIKLAISRKQEFKADATGALLTRDPEALASALIKISSNETPLRKVDNATAHLYFSSPYKEKKINWFNKLYMTHPPISERVEALRQL